jgi:molecular chaperone GrpE (heat shock protein)
MNITGLIQDWENWDTEEEGKCIGCGSIEFLKNKLCITCFQELVVNECKKRIDELETELWSYKHPLLNEEDKNFIMVGLNDKIAALKAENEELEVKYVRAVGKKAERTEEITTLKAENEKLKHIQANIDFDAKDTGKTIKEIEQKAQDNLLDEIIAIIDNAKTFRIAVDSMVSKKYILKEVNKLRNTKSKEGK